MERGWVLSLAHSYIKLSLAVRRCWIDGTTVLTRHIQNVDASYSQFSFIVGGFANGDQSSSRFLRVERVDG